MIAKLAAALSRLAVLKPQPTAGIPRHLYLYWHQGWANAPALVRRCRDSFLRHNPDWSIHCLDSDSACKLTQVPEMFFKQPGFPLPALSDMIRIDLLSRLGGVWADATLWCQQPLSSWIDKAAKKGFFAYAKPAPDRPVASWFLASMPNHYISRIWYDAVREKWHCDNYRATTRLYWRQWLDCEHYFWFHNLFQHLLDTDATFRKQWAQCKKVSADIPHYLQHIGLNEPLAPPIADHIRQVRSPVYKLTRHEELAIDDPETIVGFLLQHETN